MFLMLAAVQRVEAMDSSQLTPPHNPKVRRTGSLIFSILPEVCRPCLEPFQGGTEQANKLTP
jgi:hypothetical protein